jgi:hypothetical protein
MASRIIQRVCSQCGGVVDAVVTDHYDSGGSVIGTTEDRAKCREGCLGQV